MLTADGLAVAAATTMINRRLARRDALTIATDPSTGDEVVKEAGVKSRRGRISTVKRELTEEEKQDIDVSVRFLAVLGSADKYDTDGYED